MKIGIGKPRLVIAGLLVVLLAAGTLIAVRAVERVRMIHVTAYFDNTNGLFVGDDIRILGVRVGKIDRIEPQPMRAKVSFSYNRKYQVPADAIAAILSPQLITARALQLTPAYTGGPAMADGAVIPQKRTVVPVEWDDLREQLQKLTDSLQPTTPGGVSTLGAFINTAADNMRGQGANIHDAIVRLSQAFSILGDHSNDIFSTIKNLSILVQALHDSAGLLSRLNTNLAAVTGLLANDPDEVGRAIADLSDVVGETSSFIADNREAMGTAMDKLSSISTAVHDSLDDIKQTLHVAPNTLQNFINIYNPAQMGATGIPTLGNFADPITFICGAVQAASKLNAEQSAKLCVQYLAPIMKNRRYSFPPIGALPFVGTQARPNELTYSEDWLRPNYIPPAPPPTQAPGPNPAEAASPPLPAEQPASSGGAPQIGEPPPTVNADPAAGLAGLMVPHHGGQP